MIKFFPVGNAFRQFVQFISDTGCHGDRLCVSSLQNRDKETAVHQAGDKVAVFRFHCFCQRKQAAVMVTIKLVDTFKKIFFRFIYLSY
jgi:hypothetical protein